MLRQDGGDRALPRPGLWHTADGRKRSLRAWESQRPCQPKRGTITISQLVLKSGMKAWCVLPDSSAVGNNLSLQPAWFTGSTFHRTRCGSINTRAVLANVGLPSSRRCAILTGNPRNMGS